MTLGLLAAVIAAPTAGAVIAGNTANVTVSSPDSAAAICQVVVLVDAVLILGVEDRLGLATSHADSAAVLRVPGSSTLTASTAHCDVVIDKLRILYPDAEDAAHGRGSYVSGPAPVTNETLRTGVNAWNVTLTGAGSQVAVCQYLVLVDSVVIGGGAYGLPTGETPRVLAASTASDSAEADARCSARVNSVEVTHR